MKWRHILFISAILSFLFLIVVLAWMRFLLLEAWELSAAELDAICLMKKYNEQGAIDKSCILARAMELGVLQYVTYRNVKHAFPDVLANHYWHRMDEYALPVCEEQRFNTYMSNAMINSCSRWYQFESEFVYYDSPWSNARWRPNWMTPFINELKNSSENGSEN